MKLALVLATLAACTACLSAAQAAPAARSAIVAEGDKLELRLDKQRLDNGLELILIEDHRLPLVAFNLWVHAGPRNEAAGQTGFAHLFEHLMFAGTRHIPRGEADKIIDTVGGTDSNGTTNFDRTNYFFTLPANQLELGLWIKSDMLGYMIDQVDATALANQQDVVRNERRQSIENRPYGVVDEAVFTALFPPGHPYRASIMGSHADIQSIKLDDVRAFSRTYYRPNNATLVLAGDFDPKRARELVDKYFGSLKAGGPVPPVAVAQPAISAERRLVVTDRIELPRLTMAWHSPAMYKPGDAELDVAAQVLGGGKSSRLFKKLVYERQIAQSVEASQYSLSLGSVFTIEVVARPGQSLDEIERVVDEELVRLAKEPPTAEELQRARTTFETQLFGRIEKLGGLAELVNHYNQIAGDPDYLAQDVARYRTLTPESVRSVVAAQLRREARVLVQAMPGEKVLAAEVPTPPAPAAIATATANSERQGLNADEAWRERQPAGTAARPFSLPAGKRFTLSNGLTVVHVAKPGVPLVSATLVLRAGQDRNPLARPGLAGFTAEMLDEGTRSRSALRLADDVADLGASLSTTSGREDARLQVDSLARSFPRALALLAEVALEPAFAADELERQRKARSAALAQQRENPARTAATVAAAALYGARHPLGANPLGDEAAIGATTREDLQAFWRRHYRPDQAALVVAGDITEAELRRLAARSFGGWKRPAHSADGARSAAPEPSSARIVLVDQPGAPQTALRVVAGAPPAATPDAAAIEVMNAAMGGLFTSRIVQQLREVKGYTYGIYSGYTLGRENGQFAVQGSVRTEVTGAALKELFEQFDGMRAAPLGKDELERARNASLLSLPGQFDTDTAIARAYAGAWSAGQPADYFVRLPKQLAAVDGRSAFDAAKRHVEPAKMIVIMVGDKATVLPQIEASKLGPVQQRDAAGRIAP